MLDWQTVSLIAGIVSNSVGSIDKIYRGYADFLKEKKGDVFEFPPDFQYTEDSKAGAFVATSRQTGVVYQKITYEELRQKLNPGDRQYVEGLSDALNNYAKQWSSAYLARSMASGMDVGRYDAQLEFLAKQIADPLLKVLNFVESMGMSLDDHYLAARDIAKSYLAGETKA